MLLIIKVYIFVYTTNNIVIDINLFLCQGFSEIVQFEHFLQMSNVEILRERRLNFCKMPAHIAVCNLASEKLKVVLSGEGADEIFGGYNVYSEPDGTAYDRLPKGVKKCIGSIAQKLPAKRGVNFFVRKGKDLEERFIVMSYILPVVSMNCHKPHAPTLDIATGLRALSTTAKYFNSKGS